MNTTELIVQLGGLVGAFGVITAIMQKWLSENIKQMNKSIDKMDYSSCKTYLTDFLTDIENGIKKSEIQIQRANELYDHYILDLDGNSYIKTKWDQLMK